MKFHRFSFTKVTTRATKSSNYHSEGLRRVKKIKGLETGFPKEERSRLSSHQRETQGHFFPLKGSLLPPPPRTPAMVFVSDCPDRSAGRSFHPGFAGCASVTPCRPSGPTSISCFFESIDHGVRVMRQELSVQPLTPLSHTISGVKKWLLGFLMVCQKSLVDNNSLVGFPGNYSHLLHCSILQFCGK